LKNDNLLKNYIKEKVIEICSIKDSDVVIQVLSKDEYDTVYGKTIVILGNTGAGKSTFIEMQGINKISHDGCLSFTKQTTLYRFENKFNLIDTPGFNDSEGRTQDLMDTLYSECYNYGKLNVFLILHRYNGRSDETLSDIIKNFILFTGKKLKNILICLTGNITDDQINEVSEEIYIRFSIQNILKWDKANYSEYNNLIDKIKEMCKFEGVLTKTMERIITYKQIITDLEEQLNQNIVSKDSIKQKIEEIKIERSSCLAKEWQCIGITQSGLRCKKSMNCFLLKKL